MYNMGAKFIVHKNYSCFVSKTKIPKKFSCFCQLPNLRKRIRYILQHLANTDHIGKRHDPEDGLAAGFEAVFGEVSQDVL